VENASRFPTAAGADDGNAHRFRTKTQRQKPFPRKAESNFMTTNAAGFGTPVGDDENDFWQAFLSTDEAAEWFAFTDAVEAGLETSAGTITVPADFLRRAIAQLKAEPLLFQHMKEAHDRLRAARTGSAGEGN
jgi:hypothetical protein